MLPGTVTSSKVQPTTNFAVFSLFGLDSKIVKSDRTDTRDFLFFFIYLPKYLLLIAKPVPSGTSDQLQSGCSRFFLWPQPAILNY